MHYSFASIGNFNRWFGFGETIDLFSGFSLDNHERLILSSDGSLTRLLESLYMSPVEVEVKDQKKDRIEEWVADYLCISPYQDVMIRDIWLTKGKERLVYASSVFPVAGLDETFLEKLKKGEEPIGHLLRTHNLLTMRDKWEIGVIQCREVADDLRIPADVLLWARRYRLLASPIGGMGITAAILEIFSPAVIKADFRP
ncbi:MAG: hypothetical protein A2073_07835 [Deltaproteobacteria bacterium GWC2_42_11]|nr:MAG: hypothetical protein A2073_07835 [Deltaproteobacteria bacterium GWC2_42_11]HBO84455.1 hypothetical protein [Deltaproteobacteria bacterium]